MWNKFYMQMKEESNNTPRLWMSDLTDEQKEARARVILHCCFGGAIITASALLEFKTV